MLQNLIVGPLGRALGLILLFSVFAMVGGGINSIFLQALDSGVVNSERVDRILAKSATVTSADDVDAVWGDHVDITEGASGEVSECKVGTLADNAAGTYFTPRGTEITVVAGATTATDAYVKNCAWSPPSPALNATGTGSLVQLIFSAMALGLPIGALISVVGFGSSFVEQTFGASKLMVAIGAVVVLVMAGSLLGVFVPFFDVAFRSLDGARYAMYETGIGSLAGVLGNFMGVTLAAGLIRLGWVLFGQYTGIGAGKSQQGMQGAL